MTTVAKTPVAKPAAAKPAAKPAADKAKPAASKPAADKAKPPSTSQMADIVNLAGDGKGNLTREQLAKKATTVNADSFVLNTMSAATSKEIPLTAADKKFLTAQAGKVKTQADTINYMVDNWDTLSLGKGVVTAGSIKTVEALDGKAGFSQADKTIAAYLSADNKEKNPQPQQDVEQAGAKKPQPVLQAGDVSTQSLQDVFGQIAKSSTNNVSKTAVDAFAADQTKMAKILFTAKDAKFFDPKFADVTSDLLNRTQQNVTGADQLKSKFTTLSAGDVMRTGRLDTLGKADLDIADVNADGKITQAEFQTRATQNQKNAKILTAQMLGLDVSVDGVVNVNSTGPGKGLIKPVQADAQAAPAAEGTDVRKLTQVFNSLTNTPGKTSITQADISKALAGREATNAVFRQIAADGNLSESERAFAQSRLKSNEGFNTQLKYLQTNWNALSGGSQTLTAGQIQMLSAADGQMGGITAKDLAIGKARVETPVAPPAKAVAPAKATPMDPLLAYYNGLDVNRTGQVTQEQLDRRQQSQQAGIDLIAKLKDNPAYAAQVKTLDALSGSYTRGLTNTTLLQKNYLQIASTDNQFGVLSQTDLRRIDTNGDGTISQAEVDAQQKKALTVLADATKGTSV